MTERGEAPPPRLRRDLARAVHHPDPAPFQITEDNRRGPDTTIERAVADDLAYCLRVDRDMLAVDFDKPGAAEDAAVLFLSLRMHGLLPVLLISGGEDRRHVFCRVPPSTLPSWTDKARAVKGDVRARIRPPLSRHRHGGRGALLIPEQPEEALRRLQVGTGHALGQRTRSLIARAPEASDKSAVITSVALGCVNAGWSFEEFWLLLTTPGTAVSGLFAKRFRGVYGDRALKWAKTYTWDSAVAYVASNPARRAGDAQLMPQLLGFESSSVWAGRDGPTTRAVFLALVRIYERCGVMPFNASQRELAELAGLGSRNTVTKALARLEDEGIIVKRSGYKASASPEDGYADAWEFGSPATTPVGEVCGNSPRSPLDRLDHDLFHQRELGKTAQLVYDRVAAGVGTISHLRESTGLSHRTIKRSLKVLTEAGLVEERTPEGGWAVKTLDLDAVAGEMGTVCRSQAQRLRHKREREQYQRRFNGAGT